MVGSIFRTADNVLYLCGITPAPTERLGNFRPQLTKVSLGAEKTVPWFKISSSLRFLKKLKQEGFFIYAIEQAKTSIPYYRIHLSKKRLEKTALIFGNEISGLPSSVLKLADKVLEIPMYGQKESLNVAVAFGVVIFHFLHSRR